MTDADELAQRYLTLWTQYLTALMANPQAMETLKRWTEFASRFSYPAPGAMQDGGTSFPAWPPFFGPFGMPAAPIAASENDAVAALIRRVDALECRLATLERQTKSRRNRAATNT
jgi:hypothetical protein